MTRVLALVLVGILGMNHAETVFAQNVEDCPACELDREARQAVVEGRLAEAERSFARALAISPNPARAFNLAVVQQNQGKFASAYTLLRDLEAERYGPLPTDRIALVVQRLADLSERVATIELALQDEASARVWLDGRPSGRLTQELPLRMYTDPGPHTLQAVAEDGRERSFSLSVEEGSQRRIDLTFPDPEADSGANTALPIILSIAGAVAVATTVGIVVAVNAGDEPLAEPPATFLGTVEALIEF